MKYKVYISLAFLCLIIILLYSCKGSSSVANKQINYAYLYNPSSSSLHPSMHVFHLNDSVSELVIKLFPDELLFNKANIDGEMRAYLTIKFELRKLDEKGDLVIKPTDSLVLDYTLKKDEVNKRYYISTLFKAYRGEKYYMSCNVLDNNRNSLANKFLNIDKSDIYNEQNFRVLYEKTKQLIFNPKVVGSETLFITHADTSIKKLYVKFYKDYQTIPPPAYMVLAESDLYAKYDSLFTVEFDNHLLFNPENEGLYLFQIDTSFEKGLSIMRYYDGFPKIEESMQLVRPLEYLESPPRFKQLIQSKNIKLAVDEFWLDVASENTERARQLLRIYYNRVFISNYYFTSYKEGWMTDRGMVFIIYGQPDLIYKNHKSENWIYLGERMSKLIDFRFEKKDNAFSDNHFILKRSDAISIYWNEAILSWNKGMVFSVENLKK